MPLGEEQPGSFGDNVVWQNAIRTRYRELALRVVVGGYRLLQRRVGEFGAIWWNKENRFNAELTNSMNEFIEAIGFCNIFTQFRERAIHAQDYSGGGNPDTIPEIDVCVHCSTWEFLKPWVPYFVFEGKRLNNADSHLAREYVVEGMRRHIDGQYPCEWAGMLGYVIEGNVPPSVTKINNAILSQSDLSAADQLMPGTPVDGYQWIYHSEHAGATPRSPLPLVHFMLEF